MKACIAALAVLLACSLQAEPVCVGETCYPSREAAVAAGALPAADALQATDAPPDAKASNARVAFGYMRPPQFVSFLREEKADAPFAGRSALVVVLLVLLGGILANLTPCVLPLVPVNVAILLGRGELSRAGRFSRGLAYCLGMAAAYGALGLAAAFGGMAFGTVQASPWFNVAVAIMFVVLGLGMLDVVNIDVASFLRNRPAAGRSASRGLGGVFLLGAGAAVLAGACVQPILMAMLLYTADGFAAGRWWTVSLPFVLGLGMGLPWVFVAAGLSVLPRPGAWMKWVKRGFALVMFAMAAWYARLAWDIYGAHVQSRKEGVIVDGIFEATPSTWRRTFDLARNLKKPVLVDIWATWCKNCIAMEKTTFTDSDVRSELERFSVVRLQAEDLADLAKIPELKGLDIKGIPAFVILYDSVE